MKSIEGVRNHVPIFWTALTETQIAKDCFDFLDSCNSGMVWHNNDISWNVPHTIQASILSQPVFFLSDNIANGSLSANGKLLINTRKNEPLNGFLMKNNDPVTRNNSFVKDGKIDMDLILIISAGVSGLLLILMPERKRKRDIIKETNLALLRRPRQ